MVASPNGGCFPQAILAVDLANCDLFPVFFQIGLGSSNTNQ